MMSSIADRRRLPRLAALAGTMTAVALGVAACAPQPAVQCDFTPLMANRAASPPMLGPLVPGTMQPVPLNAVSVIDETIIRKVLVQSVRAGRTPTGNMSVETRLVNCTDYPLQVDGRTLFLTADGGDAEAASMWQRVALPPRSFGSYAESSVAGARAESFLIEVKEAR
ncbi:MAG: hypothetical protein LDL26_03235 [Caenispirillum bisanense]|nr:hypothetical protein [Caenispirillum bisanense]